MTQGQIINLLDSIMPDIVSTRDPEGTMLKCAKEHNLAPAQLQKLAQVFNTAKTNVFLKQASNRGDSFSIVDPERMLSEYVSYRPGASKSTETKKVHNTVDKLLKNAGTSLSGWARKNADFLLGHGNGNVLMQDFNTTESELGEESADFFDVKHTKAASAESDEEMSVWEYDSAVARWRQQAFDAKMDLSEKMASIKDKFRDTEYTGAWAETVEDLVDRFGVEKAASVIRPAEEYLTAHNVKYAAADLSKRTFVRPVVVDRHGMFDTAGEVIALQEKLAEANSALEKLAKRRRHPARNSYPGPAVGPLNGNLLHAGFGAPVIAGPDGNPAPAGLDTPPGDSGPAGSSDPAGIGENPSPTPIVIKEDGGVPSDAAAQALLDGMKSPFLSTPKASLPDMLSDFKEKSKLALGNLDNGQDKIEKAVDNAKRETTLNQLMLSDPVLASKDPEEVREMYDLIAEYAPMYATEPRLMAPVLAEALQYGSIPVQQMAEILKAQKSALEVKKLQSELGRK